MTIGIVDTGQSLDHPSLLTTSTGERKIIDWVTGTDPLTDNDPTWLNMANQVTAAGGTLHVSGTAPVTYTAPADGTYRFDVFNERDTRLRRRVRRRRQPRRQPNRDGDEADVFGVLWNTTTNQVFVDRNHEPAASPTRPA